MFGFIRRVSTSLLPRPDRPWRDDATSNAPTIGRKRRFSVTEHDDDDSASPTAKKAKGELGQLDAEAEPASTGEDTKGEATQAAEGEDVREVTKGVKEVDLEDKEGGSSRPEGVPLPDSPCGTPQPESELSEEALRSDAVEETNGQEHPDDQDSVASSSGKADGSKEAEKGSEDKAELAATTTNTPADEVVRSKDASPDPSNSDDTIESTEVRA
ncbi:hypothetical protein PAXINDRAFT_132273 [Paxillus involutus ATCC 200175]|nr:hypothetical protein PAXINDRAFT_132273 [Paxillus involutus ATCC 200175]